MRPADPVCKWCGRPADLILDEWEDDAETSDLSPDPVRLCVLCLSYYLDPQLCRSCGANPCTCCPECGAALTSDCECTPRVAVYAKQEGGGYR